MIAIYSAGKGFPPMEYVTLLRTHYPQFAQQAPRGGGYMQQDAEEFYNIVTQSISAATSPSDASASLVLEMEETLTCAETDLEPQVVRREIVNKLVCNIQGGPGSTVSVNYIAEGLRLGLEVSIEKSSEVLGRNAIWNKKQRLMKLPKFMCVQFMRFFWKLTPESRDHTGVKCKILRPVAFSEVWAVESIVF